MLLGFSQMNIFLASLTPWDPKGEIYLLLTSTAIAGDPNSLWMPGQAAREQHEVRVGPTTKPQY